MTILKVGRKYVYLSKCVCMGCAVEFKEKAVILQIRKDLRMIRKVCDKKNVPFLELCQEIDSIERWRERTANEYGTWIDEQESEPEDEQENEQVSEEDLYSTWINEDEPEDEQENEQESEPEGTQNEDLERERQENLSIRYPNLSRQENLSQRRLNDRQLDVSEEDLRLFSFFPLKLRGERISERFCP